MVADGNESVMSKFKFSCSNCGQHLECGEEYIGRQIPCPSCKALIAVPAAAAKASPIPLKSGMTFVPDDWRKSPPTAGA
jgi:hypothetical protein